MARKGNMPVPQKWSGQDKRFGETVKSNLDVLCGFSGDPLDRALTARDLLDSGIVKLTAGSRSFSGSSTGLAPIVTGETYGVPPAPTNLEANGAFQTINLSWELSDYVGRSYVEVHRHTSNVIADATLVGQASGLAGLFSDPVGGGQTYYYWVRAVNQNGVAGPFNSSTGTLGQTATDTAFLLDELTDEITESQLATDLQTEIDKISGGINVSESVNARIANAAITQSQDIADAVAEIAGASIWNDEDQFNVGDKVRHSDRVWVAAAQNTDSEPTYSGTSSTNSDWTLSGIFTGVVNKEDSGTTAAAINVLTGQIASTYATATDVTTLEAALFNDLTGVDNWDAGSSYVEGNRVIFEQGLYRAVASSTNVEPDTDSSKWVVDTMSTASALSALEVYADQNYASATNLTDLESSIFNNVIGAPDWANGTTYSAGATVTYNQKIYRALQSTAIVVSGEPTEYALPTNTTYWVQDTLTTADQVEAAYAKSSDVTVLQSNLFDNMVDVDEWSNSASYSVGDRVVHTTSTGVKKLYKALIANSGSLPPNYISEPNPKWALDTLASALAVDSLTTFVNTEAATTSYVGGQFTEKLGDLGNLTVAGKFNNYRTASDQDTATTEEVDAAYAAIFTETTGLDDWATGTSYDVGDRVVHRADATSPRKVYKALEDNSGFTPHNNSAKWEVDTLAFAGALSTLDATVNADGTGLVDKTDAIELRIDNVGDVTMEQKFTAQATDIGDLESQYTVKIDSNGHVAGFGLANTTTASGTNTSEFYVNADKFAILPNAVTSADPAWSSSSSYAEGNRVTRENKLYQARVAHSNQQPPNDTYWDDLSRSPFSVTSSGSTTADGVYVPAGVYINNAMIKHASITSAQIGSVDADTIDTGTLNVTDLIEANAIEASKLLLDSTSLEETTLSDGTKALSVKAVSASKIEAGTIDATNVTISNLWAENISGDISKVVPFTLGQSYVDIGYNNIIWSGTIPAPSTVNGITSPKRPFVNATGWGNFENDDAYRVMLKMRVNSGSSTVSLGNLMAKSTQGQHIGNGVVIYNYFAEFSGDKRSSIPDGAELQQSSTTKGYAINNTYNSSTNRTVVQYTPASGQTFSVGTATNSAYSPTFIEVAFNYFRSQQDYHGHAFNITGGLGSATTHSVDVEIRMMRYAPNYQGVPYTLRTNDKTNDRVYGLYGTMMSLR